MNTEFLKSNVEKLESVFLNIIYLKPEDRIIAPDMSMLGDLKESINAIFDDNQCINVIYTVNTDKPYFGIKINPAMSPSDAAIILGTDERVRLNKYQIEFDSRLFDIGLSEEELAAATIYEISSTMCSNSLFDNIRALVDYNALKNEEMVNIRDSVNFSQLVIFALKDTMYKLASMLFVNDPADLVSNPMIEACNYADIILSADDKIRSNISGDTMRSDKPVVLQWMFIMISDIKHNSGIISDTLKDARNFTGSKLDINEIDKTLTAIDHIDMSVLESVEYTDINKFFDAKNLSAVNETSIFKNLKKNGLRGLENELYEYAMRVKNCTTSEDAYLIMRGLNSRIGILEDYLSQEKLSDYDRNHWTDVCNRYRELRVILSKKKFKEKSYGLFWDYNKLYGDDSKDEE